MQHFFQNIQGFDDGIPPVYQAIVQQFPSGSHFVEVGSWKGKSTAFMAVEIINSQKDIKFDCVDTWMGSEEHQEGGGFFDPLVKEGKLFEHFTDNMKPVEGRYTPVRKPSVEAAEQYEDNSLDFVFIDAAHDYDNVKADIHAWYPKVKENGILAGHDWGHPPVARAVQECLENPQIVHGCWLIRK
jgi:hypothetical protein